MVNIKIFGEHDARTVEQIERTASNGAVRGAALCADGHVGYAVPIGGVVAYEDKISPSGVGFDIACLAAGTRVMTESGWRPIETVTLEDAVTCWDGETARAVAPHFGSIARGEKPTLRLTLSNGRALLATPDHTILTKTGWRAAGSLTLDDAVACQPFVGLPRGGAAGIVPVALDDARKVGELTARGLLPLTWDNPALPALVRLLGAVSGDGHLTKNGKRVSVYLSRENDAASAAADFAALGYAASVHRRSRSARRSDEFNVYVDSTALNALFAALGSPVGRKNWPARPMPWLLAAPAWVRAQFLSGFASAEAMTPRVSPNSIPNLQIKQAGENENAIRFVADLLESLCFRVSVAPSGPERGSRRDFVLQILGGAAEQARFFEDIGFCHAFEKRCAAARAASVTWQLAAHLETRTSARDEARRLRAGGVFRRDIQARVAAQFGVSPGFVHHAIYDARGPVRRTRACRFAPDTCGEIAWVRVAAVTPDAVRPVYDIVTNDPAHCFFAEGIVVHNCGNKAVRLDIPARAIKGRMKQVMDKVWAGLEFGVGKSNETRVDHELFDDEAWKLHALKPLKQMARNQLGTIGSGNHYVDIFEDEEGGAWVGVHFGSRGLGHKTATFFLEAGGAKDGMDVDPLVLDVRSSLGGDYLEAMRLAGRYAYAGRDWVCAEVARMLGGKIVEEIHNHHNFAWKETHDGRELWVVRKGATPAFPGQKGFVGGSMGDKSVILEGVESDEAKDSLYSTVHGAGRVMSRTAARGKVNRKTGEVVAPGAVSRDMMNAWIRAQNVELRGAGVDESPHCYKRLPEVLEHHKNSIRVLHTLTPLGVAMAGEKEFDPYKD